MAVALARDNVDMPTDADARPPPRPGVARLRLRLYLDLIRWSRPAGSYLLLWPTLAALWLDIYYACKFGGGNL